MAMPTKPCMVMLRTGVDGAHYQEDAAVGCGARVRVCVCVGGWVCGCASQRLSAVSHVSDSVYARIGVAERRTL